MLSSVLEFSNLLETTAYLLSGDHKAYVLHLTIESPSHFIDIIWGCLSDLVPSLHQWTDRAVLTFFHFHSLTSWSLMFSGRKLCYDQHVSGSWDVCRLSGGWGKTSSLLLWIALSIAESMNFHTEITLRCYSVIKIITMTVIKIIYQCLTF